MARNYITRTPTRHLKFLPREHVLHAPSVSLTRSHAPHAPIPRSPTRPTCLLYFTYCHISPKVMSHCHINTRQSLTIDFDQIVDH